MADKKFNSITDRVIEHYNEALTIFPQRQIVGMFLQGSQNYGLDLPISDVDTKCILVPSFQDITLNRKPISTTHIRKNLEHLDLKDIRLYMETFRKQNLNFLEILFTEWSLITNKYYDQWQRLVQEREGIARMNPERAVASMQGIAMEKYHAMEHPYPSKLDTLGKYGYDAKQLHHLVRVYYYLKDYIHGISYEECLRPTGSRKEFLMDIKTNKYSLEEAREFSKRYIDRITTMANDFRNKIPKGEDSKMRELLEDVQYEIMKIAIKEELK